MSTRTLTDYLASLPTVTSNGSEQVPAVKGGDLVNLASQLITEPRSTTTVVAGDAGKLFFLGGQMWRYVDGTEGWDLPVGTPWPVKGYKSFSFAINQIGTNAPTIRSISDNTGIGITISEFLRDTLGRYYAFIGVDNSTPFQSDHTTAYYRQSLINSEIRSVRVTFDYVGGSPSINASAIRVDTFNASGYVEMQGTVSYELRVYP
jgi:hypothetical protein